MRGTTLGKYDTGAELRAAWDAAIASGKSEHDLLTYFIGGQYWLCYLP